MWRCAIWSRDRPTGFRYLVGTRLCFADGTPDIVAYPTDREAYGRLCKLLSIGNLRKDSEKGAPKLMFGDLAPALSEATVVDLDAEDFTMGQLFILIADETDWERSEATLEALAAQAPGRVWVGGSLPLRRQRPGAAQPPCRSRRPASACR